MFSALSAFNILVPCTAMPYGFTADINNTCVQSKINAMVLYLTSAFHTHFLSVKVTFVTDTPEETLYIFKTLNISVLGKVLACIKRL